MNLETPRASAEVSVLQVYGTGSYSVEDIHENTISVMWVGWILHHLVKTMVLVNPVLYSWTFLFKLQVVSQTN